MEFPALNTRPPTQFSLSFTRGLFHPDFARAIISILVLSCASFYHATCGPCLISELQSVQNEDSGCYMNHPANGIHSTFPADISSGSNPTARLSFESVCTDSRLFCFPSTLPGFSINEKGIDVEASLGHFDGTSPPVGSTQDDKLAANKSQSSDYGMFELFEGGKISCSLNSREGVNELSSIQKYDRTSNFDLSTCRGDPHYQKSPSSTQKKNLDVTNSDFSDSSISPYVDISPTELVWEHKFLYLPSLASITVTNTCNQSILHIYEPFSTDSQFYSCNFSESLLGPGEAVSIYFVFVPKYLGLSSGHLILQTSFGGFLVPAKGFASQSPYGIQPMLSLNKHSSGRWTKNLSLFNPYDDVLYVEELTGWISVFKEDKCYHAETVCRVDRYQVFDEPKPSMIKEGLVVQHGHIGSPLLSMRPHKQWKIDPHSNETIIEVDLSFEYGGTVIGSFWLQLLRPSQDKPDVIVVPLEAELDGESTHDDHKGSVFASFEPLLYHGNVFVAIALKNSASHLLSVLKIIEVAESKVFEFKSLEGLLLFPGTITQVALITCNERHAHFHKASPEISNMYHKCKLLVLTNESTSSHIEVPCKDIFLLCSEYWKYSFVEDGKQNEYFTSGNVRTGSLADHVRLQPEFKAVKRVEADELVLENWVSMGTRRSMSVLDVHEVFFPMVEVGSHSTKWITVKNPSKWPVVMQLIINSGEFIDECRDPEGFIHLPSGGLIHNDSTTMPKKYGFSLAEGAVTEAYVHPYEDVLFGPIFFYPSDRCCWRSSVLIRNNLSGVEWLSLRGYGGSSSLLLLEKGSKPVISIEFELESPILLNISPSERPVHMEEISHACTLPLLKELYAKNTGDLPLEFKKIKISGTECALDGFFVQNCKHFALEPGESKKLMISYQTDLSASVVYRDLELALATGILVIPMKASLPFYLLNNCRKSVFWARLKKLSLAVLLIGCLMFLFICWILPHMMSLSSLDFLSKNEIKCISSSTRSMEKTCSVHHGEKRSQCSDVWPVFGGAPQSSLQSKTLVIEDPDAVEASQPYLTVKTGKERGRRRKKKKGGGMILVSQFEVSSSQSGNSTPSSPLSPTASGTPKRTWPMSPDVNHQSMEVSSLFARAVNETQCHKAQTSEPTSVMNVPKPEVNVKNNFVSSSSTPSELRKSHSKPILQPSATFPSAGRPAPNMICSPIASTSKIAPHARAPGSKLFNEKASLEEEEREGKSGIQDKYKYDIWGDHFSGLHLINKSKDVPSMIPSSSSSSTIEKDSDSFFETSPQTLIAKSQSMPVSSLYQHPQV